jgi:hypothetical protein
MLEAVLIGQTKVTRVALKNTASVSENASYD